MMLAVIERGSIVQEYRLGKAAASGCSAVDHSSLDDVVIIEEG